MEKPISTRHQSSLFEQLVDCTHRYFGKDADQFIAQFVDGHFHKDPESLTRKDLSRLMDWVRVTVSLLTDDIELAGRYMAQLQKLAATAADTRRGPHNEERRSEAEALFTSIGDGAIATNELSRITRINPAALELLGFTREDVREAWFPRAIQSVTEAGVAIKLIDRPIVRAYLSGKTVSQRGYFLRKDGTCLPVAITVAPIIHDSRPIGAIEVFRDISVEMEVDRMKSEFISLASHQLRTPLSAVKTYTHMLIDGYMGDITPEQRRSLSTIMNATDRMNELVSTLLNITRIESGNLAISPKNVDLTKLCEDALHEVAHSAERKHIKLMLATKDALTVRTDPLIAKEIINNLVSNAIKYTPDTGRVTVRLSKRQGALILCIHDNGMGIPTEAQPKIFTKFFRAPNAIRHETSGTGLGLYLVKGLAERLSGKVWFTSQEGTGSYFYFSLPVPT